MARRWLEVVCLALVVVAATLCAPCSAQTSSTVQPTSLTMPNCPPAPISLSPCIGYVFGVGSATLSSCCSQLQAFFQSQGPCLCAVSKLAPSPLGLFLGQAQAMIPNVCNLPSNPCDDVAGASTTPVASTPPVTNTAPPLTPLAPTAPVPSATTTAPATTPTATPATPATTPSTTPADPDVSEAPPAPADDSPAAVTAPGQVTPEGAGSNTASQVASKMPELLHSAGARSSWDTAAGTVLITLFLAYVSTMYV